MAERRPRVALLATAWEEPDDEISFLTRRVGAALAMTASVDVVLADGGPAGETADGAFRVLRVASPRPNRRRTRLLGLALGAGARAAGAGGAGPPGGAGEPDSAREAHGTGLLAGAVPDTVRARLRQLAGDGWPAMSSVLRRLAPDAVVVADHRHQVAAALAGTATPYRKTLLPLAVDDLALQLSAAEGVLSGWDGLLATSRAESDVLVAAMARAARAAPAGGDAGAEAVARPPEPGTGPAGAVGEPPVHELRLALEDPGAALASSWGGAAGAGALPKSDADVDRVAADGADRARADDVLDWCAGADRMVVLDDRLWPRAGHPGVIAAAAPDQPADSGLPLAPEVDYLASRLPSLAMVVSRRHTTTLVRGRSRRPGPPLTRVDRWRLMATSAATLDLGPPRVLGRDVLESMLLATPAVARAGSGAAQRHLEESGGGLCYRNRPELGAAVQRLLDPAVGRCLGEASRRWAASTHGDRPRFVQVTSAGVLGR